MNDAVAVFFDIGDTVASPVVEAGHLAGLDVYPFVPDVLERLRSHPPVRVGLISNTGHESAERLAALLADSGLGALVDAQLCLFSSVEGIDKSSPAIFALAASRAGVPAARCVFVGEDAGERKTAEAAGLRASFHPLHALHLVETEFLPH